MAMSAQERRKAQNKEVKGGTIRKGAGGKFMRRYNAKTGRWDIVSNMSAKTGGTTTARREKGVTKSAVAKRETSKPASVSSRRTTSATVSSAVKAGRAAGPSRPQTSGKNWWQAGGGGLVGPNSPFAKPSKPNKGKKDALSTSPMTWGIKKDTKRGK